MRHGNKGQKLGRKKEPREMMLRNLAASILIYEKVITTEAKAKAVKMLVEKAITLSKIGDLSAKKKLNEVLPQKMAIKKAIEVIGKRYQDKQSGFTRIIKLGARQGDGAQTAQIELV
jgi:large subunit ribosomal protein L17